MKLNQVIALVGGRKTAIHKLLTEIHHGWKAERFMGINKTYLPKNEEGETYPPENKVVQLRVRDEIDRVRLELADFWNLVATQEASNTMASADVEVDGTALLDNVPVSTLLFMESL